MATAVEDSTYENSSRDAINRDGGCYNNILSLYIRISIN